MKIEVVKKEFGFCLEQKYNEKLFKLPKLFEDTVTKCASLANININSKEECQNLQVYARYINMNWEKFKSMGKIACFFDVMFRKWDFYIGILTNTQINTTNEISSNNMQEKEYIHTRHIGSYDKLADIYKALNIYARENDIKLDSSSIEFYLNSPKETKKEDLITDIYIPIKSRS